MHNIRVCDRVGKSAIFGDNDRALNPRDRYRFCAFEKIIYGDVPCYVELLLLKVHCVDSVGNLEVGLNSTVF